MREHRGGARRGTSRVALLLILSTSCGCVGQALAGELVDEEKAEETAKNQHPDLVLPPHHSAASNDDTRARRSYRVRASSELAGYGDSDHVFVFTPSIAATADDPVEGWSVKGRYLVDVVSAASVDVVSTASRRFREVRHAVSFSGGYKPSVFGVRATVSRSAEPDYFSWAAGGEASYDFDEKNKTLLFGYALRHDQIGRTGTPFDVFSHALDAHTLNGGVTLVVDRATLLSFVGDAVYERGDQSKPYRYVPMFEPGTFQRLGAGASIDRVNALRLPEKPLEQLPTKRDRYALTTRYAHRFLSATLRLAERLYIDSWGLKATTSDLAYVWDAGEHWSFTPHLRFHAQTPVVFWKRAYEVIYEHGGAWQVPALRTGDRELSPLTSTTIGASTRFALGADPQPDSWAIVAGVDGVWTHFFDALFITNRVGVLLTVGVEAEL